MRWARFWLITHPRIARLLRAFGLMELLSCLAVATAPAATASTNAAVLNWTGLTDTSGVPVGDLYLSLASVRDQLTQTGPQTSVLDPTSWWAWSVHALTVLFDSLTAANILTAEISVFVGVVALSMWVFRLTISTYWLTVLGELARAVTAAVIGVTTRWGLVALAVPAGVFLGALAFHRGERGRGVTLILLAVLMPALAITVFSDPAGLMYGPQGLLQFGRRMAFSTAQAATHGGAISGGGFTGQVDTLTSSLITHVVREPLEVFNFGHVVDRVGGCGPMVSAAYKQGLKDGPIHALAQCGDTAAVHYAQNLDGTNVVGGAILALCACLFGWFMVSAGASVFMVSVKAVYTCAKLLPSLLVGGVDAGREHAKSTVWRFFRHPLEVMVYVTFVSVIGLAIERLIARPLPAELGGNNPFAHVLIMAGASLMALHLLRHIRADLAGGQPGRGVLGRAGDVALGLGLHAALGGAGRAALGGARGVRGMLGGRKTPWEKLDDQAAHVGPQEVLGPPQAGFDPIPGQDGTSPDTAAGATPPGDPSAPRRPAASPALPAPDTTPGLAPVGAAAATTTAGAAGAAAGGTPASLSRRPSRGAGPDRSAPARQPARGAQRSLDADSPPGGHTRVDHPAPDAPQVAPITDIPGQPRQRRRATGEHRPPAAGSYVHHTEDIPPPTEPPPADFDLAPPPPPDELGPSTATVDPVTGH